MEFLQQAVGTYSASKVSSTHMNNIRLSCTIKSFFPQHQTTLQIPDDVNKPNQALVFHNLFDPNMEPAPRDEQAFFPGDFVRVSLTRYGFQKSYTIQWSEEIFRVASFKLVNDQYMYLLEDLRSEP